jgi:hypothetical protein
VNTLFAGGVLENYSIGKEAKSKKSLKHVYSFTLEKLEERFNQLKDKCDNLDYLIELEAAEKDSLKLI